MANKSDRKTIIEACGNVVKLASGIGTWKIANWVLDAVMPASVKLPVRVCVRTAMWVLTGMIQEKSDDYIDRSANDISEALEEVIEDGRALVKNETEQEEEPSDPAKEAAEHAVKRNDYIQKRKEKNATKAWADITAEVKVDGDRLSWTFDNRETAVVVLCGMQEWIGRHGGTDADVESVEMVSNLAMNDPTYTVVVPKDIGLKYGIVAATTRKEAANQIVDLTFSGASEDELSKAIQRSIDIMDAEKKRKKGGES